MSPTNRMLALAVAACCAAPTIGQACSLCDLQSNPGGCCPLEALSDGDPSAFHFGDESDELAAFQLQNNGWTSTSSGSSALGAPVVLTWSIAPDGTTLPRGLGEPASPSDLVQFLDGIHHPGEMFDAEDQLSDRDWFGLVKSSFDRWSSVAGITFNYEPNDDGASLPSNRGIANRRGDHRLSGHFIDGGSRPSVIAYNYFPNFSDMVIDTSETSLFSNPSQEYLILRNTIMHELGHGLGLAHVESADLSPAPGVQFGTFLMEPILATVFEGPQFDDILGAHRLYGDVFEKGSGNQIYQNATDLEALPRGGKIQIGTDAGDTFVDFDDIDFVSADDNSDTDYYKFTIDAPGTIDLVLKPMGPTYLNGRQGSAASGSQPEFNAAAQSDLTLTLFDTNGLSPIGLSNTPGMGITESILGVELNAAGTYYVRITSATNAVQMYQLTVESIPEPSAAILLAGATVCLGWRRRGERTCVS